MDYESEQAMELEALQAIFPDDLEEFEGNTPADWPQQHGKMWAVNINPSAEVGADDEDAEPELQMQLVFAHTPTYPDEPPCIRLRSVRGLGDAELAEATAELQQHIADSMGMAMIYNLVTAAQEWLAAAAQAGLAGGASHRGAVPAGECSSTGLGQGGQQLRSVRGLGDAELAEATAELQQHIADSMGMAMIYNLVTAAQEWLAARLAAGPAGSGLDPEAEERRKRDEAEAARAAARAHGTPVTAELFEAWRKKFEAEQALAKVQLGEGSKAAADGAAAGRMSGKAWFLAQMAAGKVVSESSEEEDGEEDGEEDAYEGDGEEELLDDDEDEDIDYEDDDDDGLLDEYLASKA
uniref:RWD domain-containing protein n=1 Tax=Tetradesmus obliquus TaxID=3088 RepID=A0A383VH30_TETOB|eukprot:jgi/Sobl393_1/17564/SZX64052.1